MPPATLTKPKQEKKSPTLQESCERYIRKHFLVSTGQKLKVSHLWDTNFRVTTYSAEQSERSSLTYDKLVESKFVRISIDDNGIMSHKVLD